MKGTLESFRQQWKKEVGLHNEKLYEANEKDITQSKVDTLDQEKEGIANQSPESDLEKKVGQHHFSFFKKLLIYPYFIELLLNLFSFEGSRLISKGG